MSKTIVGMRRRYAALRMKQAGAILDERFNNATVKA